jgi:hypothetical protein
MAAAKMKNENVSYQLMAGGENGINGVIGWRQRRKRISVSAAAGVSAAKRQCHQAIMAASCGVSGGSIEASRNVSAMKMTKKPEIMKEKCGEEKSAAKMQS